MVWKRVGRPPFLKTFLRNSVDLRFGKYEYSDFSGCKDKTLEKEISHFEVYVSKWLLISVESNLIRKRVSDPQSFFIQIFLTEWVIVKKKFFSQNE